ncbi:MAG: DUF986 family protein [Bacillus sp. (in: firmicutes)]
MGITEIVLLAINIIVALYGLVDFILAQGYKKRTILTVNLRKWGRIDNLIFVGFIAIMFASNIMRGGDRTVSLLLGILVMMLLYFAFIHSPKVFFKKEGFHYNFSFVNYDNIKTMNLSEDGVLVIDTDRRRLLLKMTSMDDLEKVLQVLVKN